MNEATYSLEWRGTVKSGLSYDDIEAGLVSGDLHTLYKIQVNGRRLVLRDFLEQQRPLLARTPVSQSAPPQPAFEHPGSNSLPRPELHSAVPPPPPMGKAVPTLPAFATGGKAPKPVWFWPAVILSSTVCLLLGVVFIYMSVTAPTRSGSSSGSTHTAETQPEEKPAEKKFKPFSFTGKEIFPSALLSTAGVDWNGDEQSAEDKKTEDDAQIRKSEIPIYGDENSWLGVEISGLNKGAQVSVEITSDGLMKSGKWQGTVTTLGQHGRAMIRPKVIWDYEALRKALQQRPINVIFSVSVDGTPLPEATEIYTLRSINDCPLYVTRDKSGKNMTSLSFLFAAYVNENHPQVQEILKEALECHIVDQFDGYLSENPKQVFLQVWAIWNALQRRGIKYSNVAATTPGDTVISQSVRFLDQSINDHQANCVDGSVLMASVLQKIGINSYLVIIPGHCFLAFDLTPDSAALPVGLETTMLGDNEITEVKNLGYLPNQDKFKEYDASYKTFGKAVDVGISTIQANARTLQSQSDVRFRLVSIEEERNFGIKPISFTMDK
ncbi:hypothetical protein [Prosthecobacter fluviatilis]|uniref:Transglutaminase-like domain-containing protein n=1 Tax=Prosthecobacter fluviatilis TaxID=445931 RepID=A0ABW0KNR6_9BACT